MSQRSLSDKETGFSVTNAEPWSSSLQPSEYQYSKLRFHVVYTSTSLMFGLTPKSVVPISRTESPSQRM